MFLHIKLFPSMRKVLGNKNLAQNMLLAQRCEAKQSNIRIAELAIPTPKPGQSRKYGITRHQSCHRSVKKLDFDNKFEVMN